MDISEVTDLKELKSMAYDQMVKQEQAQADLRNINMRIQQVLADEEKLIEKS